MEKKREEGAERRKAICRDTYKIVLGCCKMGEEKHERQVARLGLMMRR